MLIKHDPQTCPFIIDPEFAKKYEGIPGRSPIVRFEFVGHVNSRICPTCYTPILFEQREVLLFERWVAPQLLYRIFLTAQEFRFVRRVAHVTRPQIPEKFRTTALELEHDQEEYIDLLNYLNLIDFLRDNLYEPTIPQGMFDLHS